MSGHALPHPRLRLSNGRFAVRPWLEEDLDCVREASTDPEIVRGTTVPANFNVDEGLSFIRRQWSRAEERVGVSQAVVDIPDDRAIGLIIVSLRPQARVGGLGYWIVPAARGRGAATAAVELVAPWAFEALGLMRLEAWVDPSNLASQRVLLNAGFQEEGRLRNFFSTNEGSSDAMVYARVP